MTTEDFLRLAITAVFTGGLGVAIVNIINERWKFRAQRRAAKEDKEAEKADKTKSIEMTVEQLQEADKRQDKTVEERFQSIETQINGQSMAMRLILLDRILYLGQKFIDEGEITYDDRRRIRQMHDCYHNVLLGNGDADLIMKGIDKLPLKHNKKEAEDHGSRN